MIPIAFSVPEEITYPVRRTRRVRAGLRGEGSILCPTTCDGPEIFVLLKYDIYCVSAAG